jgi:adenylate kinase family enzyme
MKRVAVVGVTGSGKTTFASTLSQRLGVPAIELDAFYWQPNWTPPADRDEFRSVIAAYAAADGWVIEGNYTILLSSPAYQHIHAIRLRSPAEASNWLANTWRGRC